MLNKLLFNNLVISNKKKIRQGRTQAINKLVERIRKMKTMMEKQPENEKTKERLRKYIEYIDQLKKLKLVDVMKKVLILDKVPQAILSDAYAVPEEVVVAILATNKIIAALAKQFREKLGLKEACKDWKNQLMEPSKRKLKVDRIEDKRRKRSELKMQKVIARKRLEWLQENNPDVEQLNGNVSVAHSTDGNWIEESMEKEEREKANPISPPSTNDTEKADRVGPQSLREIKYKKESAPKVDQPVSGGQRDQSQIKNKKLKAETAYQKSKATVKSATAPTRVVDPFFVTASGENYLSTVVVSNKVEQENKDTFVERYPRKTKYVQKTQSGRDRPYQKIEYQPSGAQSHKKQQHVEGSGKSQLHPSWAAKQKFKPVITNFEGKKIVFSDANDKPVQIESVPKQRANLKKIQTSGASSEQMHPSWVAKQKTQPSVRPFEGKKIIFNCDDE